MTFKFITATAAAALLATTASAQMLSDTIGTDYDFDTFDRAYAANGVYDGLDQDGDTLLGENEFRSGMYADYDRDRDVMISQSEFDEGNVRYYGDTYAGSDFATYDANTDGMLDQNEFSGFYGTEYTERFSGYDADADGMLNSREFNTKLYETADMNRDAVITVEEEGFFEGWFDGDDITARVREIGPIN